eukprot:758398-Hanusia_phi.AAC.2
MTSKVTAKGEAGSQRKIMVISPPPPSSSELDQAIDALERIGMPILAADLSTMIALLALLGSKSRIFFSFFCILFTVLLLGGMHAVVFLPVFLGYFGPVLEKEEPEPNDKDTSPLPVLEAEILPEERAECVIVERNFAGEYGSG